jgi:DNA (cytosine-5)-methyltransferase 1
MKFLSVCSGIEAASVAWNPIGWEAIGFSEIEPFPCAVLKHHYPSVPNFGDMTKFKEWPDATIDVLCGGTPCQSFSVAGLRKGLDDPRGNLMLTFLAIAKRYRPQWVVWENVPGVLSSNGGRDFGSFLGGLAECGYGFAYRVLDAQYFGVAQRRKRVFVVGYLGDWHRAAAVLFEQHSLQGHPAPSRETRKRIAPTVTNGPPFSRTGNERVEDQALVWPADVASTLNAHFGDKQGLEDQHALGGGHCSSLPQVAMCLNAGGMKRQDSESETLIPTIGGGFDGPVGVTLHGTDGTASVASFTDLSSSLRSRIPSGVENSTTTAVMQPVAFADTAQTITAGFEFDYNDEKKAATHLIGSAMQVRRLTPVECERLQGFPDDYTAIPWRRKPATECPDGPRYKALGNSWAVPVARWIGERINKVEAWTS